MPRQLTTCHHRVMTNVYEAFCATLQLANQEELGALELVDEEVGLIARYAQLCDDR